ncbi:MAG: aminotransferase class V-fold PLP-dependent enzyme [Niabella sp.]
MMQWPVYLDNCATTACDPRVVEVMLPYFTQHYGNAGSKGHAFGWRASSAVDRARQQVASLLHATPEEIVFTSGATEACNLALRGVFERYAAKGNHIITVQTEHKAVLDTCRELEKKGAEITYLPVSTNGQLDIALLESAIKPSTILIAVMYANNETGVLHPVKEIGALAKEKDILFFCDATQAVGKLPVNVLQDNIDLLAFSGHKLYASKGIGALYVRRKASRVLLSPQITGGGQERGLRSGTLNVPGIVALGKACAICEEEMDAALQRLSLLRDRLENVLLQLPEARLNGLNAPRLPHVTNISFRFVNSSCILSAIGGKIAASSGSACTSGSLDPSFVLKAMGIADEWAKCAIRLSLGRFTTEEEIDFCANEIRDTVQSLRAEDPVWQMFFKD